MFQTLIESAARPSRPGKWTITSTAVHAAVITGAVVLTLREPPPELERPRIVQLALPRPVSSAPTTPTATRAAAPGSLTFREIRVAVPTFVPHEIVTGGLRVVGDPLGETGTPTLVPVMGPVSDSVYRLERVDRQVAPRADNPRPDYPQSLRSAMVEGSVVVQFVVDTTGRVELQSIAILRSTHEQFSQAARRWLGRTRYMPAEIRGRPVRQLVQQEVAFTLER